MIFSHVYKATIVCEGKIKVLSYHANNKFLLQLETMDHPVFFCDADVQWSAAGSELTTEPDSCKAMYSNFLAAFMSGKRLASVWFDGDQVPATCNSWGTWENANIRHFALTNHQLFKL